MPLATTSRASASAAPALARSAASAGFRATARRTPAGRATPCLVSRGGGQLAASTFSRGSPNRPSASVGRVPAPCGASASRRAAVRATRAAPAASLASPGGSTASARRELARTGIASARRASATLTVSASPPGTLRSNSRSSGKQLHRRPCLQQGIPRGDLCPWGCSGGILCSCAGFRCREDGGAPAPGSLPAARRL